MIMFKRGKKCLSFKKGEASCCSIGGGEREEQGFRRGGEKAGCKIIGGGGHLC